MSIHLGRLKKVDLRELNDFNEMKSEYPDFIPLGTVLKPIPNYSPSPSDVKSVSDLPKRLFIGDINPNSFSIDKNGWRIEYIDKEIDSILKMKFENSTITLQQQFEGIDGGLTTISDADSFVKIISQLPIVPYKWEEHCQKSFENEYNLHYIIQNSEDWTIVGFPDGILKTIVCPLTIGGLRKSFKWFKSQLKTPCSDSPFSAYFSLGNSKVYYLTEYLPEGFDEETLHYYTFNNNGVIPLSKPISSKTKDDKSYLMVERQLYHLVIGCCYRNIKPLLKSLNEYEIITSKGIKQEYLEYDVLIVPPQFECQKNLFTYYDDKKTIKVDFVKVVEFEKFKSEFMSLQNTDLSIPFEKIDSLEKQFYKIFPE